jgi:hypothetical protein
MPQMYLLSTLENALSDDHSVVDRAWWVTNMGFPLIRCGAIDALLAHPQHIISDRHDPVSNEPCQDTTPSVRSIEALKMEPDTLLTYTRPLDSLLSPEKGRSR